MFHLLYMGGYRSKPDLSKTSLFQSKVNTSYAVKEMTGWRMFMEDTFIAEDSLANNQSVSLFAIFDGHGGAGVAIFAARHFSEQLQKHPDFKKYQYMKCLNDTFLKMDQMMLTAQGKQELLQIQKQQFQKGNGAQIQDTDSAGSTALVCLITGNFIYMANAGDSRAICSIKGQIIEMSKDHRPSNGDELLRIKNAGGYIESGRIKGDLMVSRGFGDFQFKKNKYETVQNQMVSACPQIKQIPKKDVDFIFMGCDGLWQKRSNIQMKQWIQKNLEKKSMDEVLQNLLDEQVSKQQQGGEGKDNMTAILIKINNY